MFLNAGALDSLPAARYLLVSSKDSMAAAIDRSEAMHFETKNLQNISCEENNTGAAQSNCRPSHRECMPKGESSNHLKTSGIEMLDKGYLQYG